MTAIQTAHIETARKARMRIEALLSLTLLFSFADVARAQDKKCDGSDVVYAKTSGGLTRIDRVKPATITGDTYVLDAVAGVTCNRAAFGSHASVAFHVVNINPFLHRYRVSVKGVPYVETAPEPFFSSAFGLAVPKAASGAPGGVGVSSVSDTVPHVENCVARSAQSPKPGKKPLKEQPPCEVQQLVDLNANAIAARQFLKTAITSSEDEIKALAVLLTTWKQVINDSRTPAGDVYDAADKAVNAATAAEVKIAQKDLKTLLKNDQAAAEALAKAIEAVPATWKDCDFVKYYAKSSRNLTDTFADLKSKADKIAADVTTIHAEGVATAATISDPHNFFITTILGPYDSPQLDSITVQRKPVAAEDKEYTPFAAVNARFGSRTRMSIGAGFAWAPIPEMTYSGVVTLVPPQGGRAGDTLRTLVSPNRSASGRVPPMLTLTTRVLEMQNDLLTSLNAVVGATLRKETSTQAEFYGGASLGFFNDWFFVASGAYVGYATALSPGVTVGQIIPNGSTVPSSQQLMVRHSLMVYFRLR